MESAWEGFASCSLRVGAWVEVSFSMGSGQSDIPPKERELSEGEGGTEQGRARVSCNEQHFLLERLRSHGKREL
jgi:hypothetical protein